MSITINGVSISGNSIRINGGKIIVDGKEINTGDEKYITISVDGNLDWISADSCESITVTGNSGYIKTMSGDVRCGDVDGDVKTMSGDVTCSSVSGSISTMSGDISRKLKGN